MTNAGDRIALATFQMQGEADHWWDLIKTTHDVATMTWQRFEELFLEKYFPTPLKQAMTQEFLDLKQRNLTVTQYAARFEELARYATAVVATDEARARRFEWGLNNLIRTSVVSHEYPTYAQVVRCALMIERERSDAKATWEGQRRNASAIGGPIRTTSNNNRSYVAPKPYTQPGQQNRSNYQGQLYAPQNQGPKCYNCNQEGHFKYNCPKLVGSGGSGSGGQQQYQAKPSGFGNQNQGALNQQKMGQNQRAGGRVFALQGTEQEYDPAVIQGTLILYSTCVQALFDSGASHSFISAACVINTWTRN